MRGPNGQLAEQLHPCGHTMHQRHQWYMNKHANSSGNARISLNRWQPFHKLVNDRAIYMYIKRNIAKAACNCKLQINGRGLAGASHKHQQAKRREGRCYCQKATQGQAR